MVNNKINNIILIGMPGAGKSTVGKRLAFISGYDFIDTDTIIEQIQSTTLQQILDRQGLSALQRIESSTILSLHAINHVIATGGSVVYYENAMQHLHSIGWIIYLKTSLPLILKRLTNTETRGIARHPGQTIEDLYSERSLLYEKYADSTVEGDCLSVEEICTYIIAMLRTK